MIAKGRFFRGFLALAIFGALLGVNACGDEDNIQECTLIGCESFIQVQLGDVATVYQTGLPILMEVCVNTTVCGTFVVEQSAGSAATCVQMQTAADASCSVGLSGEVDVTLNLAGLTISGGQAATSVKIRDAMDTVVFDELLNAKVDKLMPNGENCGPVCYQGSVSYIPLM